MAPLSCIICGNSNITSLETAIGERAYCGSCFHGWRINPANYTYSKTAMCALGTSAGRLAKQINFFAPFAHPGAVVLEIGCATGELAAATRSALQIARYEAIELSPAGTIAKPHLDRLYDQPLRAMLENEKIKSRFDLILMSHVLEHLEDPAAELVAMKQVLKPGGAIFLEVPNGSGNRKLPIDDNRSHLHFFSAGSLTRILANTTLNVIAAATDARLDSRYADSLQVIASPFQTPGWSKTTLSDHPALAGASDIIVWGAGSLAEEILANFFDSTRIDFFIDRDQAKQGTLCLGRPVRGPNSLGQLPRTVLVNSIDFADAIVADIENLSSQTNHTLVRIGDLIDSGDR